jgi:gastric triacylglycerol lipase
MQFSVRGFETKLLNIQCYIINLHMAHFKTFFLLAALILVITECAHPEAKLEFLDYCKYYNYPAEKHTVITEDGYILTMFRIQKKGTQIKAGLKPIILQHGLLDCSDTWLIND